MVIVKGFNFQESTSKSTVGAVVSRKVGTSSTSCTRG